VVVALGGLTAAWHDIFPKNEAAETQQSDATQPDQANASDNSGDANEVSAASDDPWTYTTDNGGTLYYQGGYWIENIDGTETKYQPQSVQNGFTYVWGQGVGENGEDVDLRWPTKGGQAEKRNGQVTTWNDAYTVTPANSSSSGN
jgi:hypothetical protein